MTAQRRLCIANHQRTAAYWLNSTVVRSVCPAASSMSLQVWWW